jgi:hypothetical protein
MMLPFGFSGKTAEGWKLWADRSDLRPHDPKEATYASALCELRESTQRLAEETEHGRFGTVAELVQELELAG